MGRLPRQLLRQCLYAGLILAVVMGLAHWDWLGSDTLRAYAFFFLTEEMDPDLLWSRLKDWVEASGLAGWWPPWERWQGGERPEAERGPGSV